MSQHFKRVLLAVAAGFSTLSASAFSMLGPAAPWQVEAIGYQLPGDIGGVMNLGEEYRWNTKIITYAYDQSFFQYFGVQGTNAIEKAFAMLNALPSTTAMSADLSEFPLESRRVNNTAAVLGILDIKSHVLDTMVQQLGLAEPERYTWTLRDRVVIGLSTNYTVIKRNFDPVTIEPSSFVNGVLYTYQIGEFIVPANYADAVDFPADPLAIGYTALASQSLLAGEYYTGFTRDDIGGLRHLYGSANPLEHWHVETLLDDVTAPLGSGSPWTPIGGTNAVSTNSIVSQAVRPGVEKITFKLGKYDSLLGAFISVTNTWDDKYITNGILKTQKVQRILTVPDIVIQAEDLDPVLGEPLMFQRTDTAAWINNDAINGSTVLPGPGVIAPPITITFNKVGPYFINSTPFSLDEATASPGSIWGSFDGTTNAPIVFPSGSSIQSLSAQAIFGNFGPDGSPWTVVDAGVTNNTTTGGNGTGGN